MNVQTSGGMAARTRRLVERRGLRERVAQLEAQAVESRQLSMRIAELTDLVAELIVPLARQDPERARDLLTKYQGELGS